MKGHIVAAGGIGFSNALKHHPAYQFEEYVMSLGSAVSSVCFIGTASGENADYTLSFYKTFSRFNCSLHHLSLFRPPEDIKSFIMQQHVIIVGGGNTKSMLCLWKEWGLSTLLQEYWMHGGILAGSSAGALCWFEDGITDSVPGELTILKCLGFLQGSLSPHFDDEPSRRPIYTQLINDDVLQPGIGLDKHAALHYQGTQLKRIIALKPHASAYCVEKDTVHKLVV